MRACLIILAAALTALAGLAQAQEPVRAGVAAAVVSPVTVSGAPRPAPVEAVTGMDIFLEDRVVTGEAARLQVLLLDETVFTVGPGTDLVIDRFVYDPERGTGEMAAGMTTGFLRYVSGRIGAEAPENVTIETPAGTLGIRGTALLVARLEGPGEAFFCGVLGPGRGNNALARPGGCLLSNAFGRTEVLRAGHGAEIAAGRAPGPAGPIPPELLERVHLALRPAGVPVEAEAALPASVAEAAAGDPLELSGQAVAEERERAAALALRLGPAYDALTEQGPTGALSTRPPAELAEALAQGAMISPDPFVTAPFLAQLTWSTVPDLDLHATGPAPGGTGRYHVFFADPVGPSGEGGAPVARLDFPDTGFANSEVLSLSELGAGGVTRISVFNFSDQTPGSTSLARDAQAAVSLLEDGLIRRGPGGTTVIEGRLIDVIRPDPGGAGNTFVAYEIAPDGRIDRVGGFADFPNPVAVD